MVPPFNTELARTEQATKPYSNDVSEFLAKQNGVTILFRFQTKNEVGLLSIGRHIYTPPASHDQWIVLGLWDESIAVPTPIGISELKLHPEQRLAVGSVGMITQYDGEDDAVVLPPALASITQIANPMASFVIRSNYQGRGYGDMLWTLTLATLNRLGIDTVKVMSDITDMNGRPSFYTRLIPTSPKNEHGSLMIPTQITPRQQSVLDQILSPSLA